VARNDQFINVAEKIAEIALNGNFKTLDELKAADFGDARPNDSSGRSLTVEEKITEFIGKTGEKMELSAYEVINAEKVFAYNHPGKPFGKYCWFQQGWYPITEVGKEISMQIAAMAPIAIDKSDVTQDTIDREMNIAKEQARQEGKPEAMLEKIAIGKVNKFYKESTLLNQDFIKDSKKTVSQFLQDNDKELKVTGFKRIVIG